MWKNINRINESSESSSLGTKRSCPICGANKSKIILELENFQFYTEGIRSAYQQLSKSLACLEILFEFQLNLLELDLIFFVFRIQVYKIYLGSYLSYLK